MTLAFWTTSAPEPAFPSSSPAASQDSLTPVSADHDAKFVSKPGFITSVSWQSSVPLPSRSGHMPPVAAPHAMPPTGIGLTPGPASPPPPAPAPAVPVATPASVPAAPAAPAPPTSPAAPVVVPPPPESPAAPVGSPLPAAPASPAAPVGSPLPAAPPAPAVPPGSEPA